MGEFSEGIGLDIWAPQGTVAEFAGVVESAGAAGARRTWRHSLERIARPAASSATMRHHIVSSATRSHTNGGTTYRTTPRRTYAVNTLAPCADPAVSTR